MAILRAMQDFGTGFFEGAAEQIEPTMQRRAERQAAEEKRNWQTEQTDIAQAHDYIKTAVDPSQLDSMIEEYGADSDIGSRALSRQKGLWNVRNRTLADDYRSQANANLSAGKTIIAEYFMGEADRIEATEPGFGAAPSDAESRSVAYEGQINSDRNKKSEDTFWAQVGGPLISNMLADNNPKTRGEKLNALKKMLHASGRGGQAAMIDLWDANIGHVQQVDPLQLFKLVEEQTLNMLDFMDVSADADDFPEQYAKIRADVMRRLQEANIVAPPDINVQASTVITSLKDKGRDGQIQAVVHAKAKGPENAELARIIQETYNITEDEINAWTLKQQGSQYYDPERFREEHPLGGGIMGQPLLAPFMPTGPDDPKIKAMEQAQEQMGYSFP